MTRQDQPAPELIIERWFNCEQPLSIDALRGRVVAIEAFQMLCPGCVAHGIPQVRNATDPISVYATMMPAPCEGIHASHRRK